MSGVEKIAVGVVGVVLYVAGAGIAYRLAGDWRQRYRYTNCSCPVCSAREWAVMFWPVAGTMWLGWQITRGVVLPLRSVFRVCAGLAKEKGDAIDG